MGYANNFQDLKEETIINTNYLQGILGIMTKIIIFTL